MNEPSWNTLKQLVYERANGCCEYCRTCEENTGQTMQIDHIDPNGDDVLENLCLACWNCNNYKRKATVIPDHETGQQVPIYNPRVQAWSDHFEWIEGATQIHGITPVGRATVIRLKMNRPSIVVARERWAAGGHHPP